VSLLLILMLAAIAEQAGSRRRAAASLAAATAPSAEVPATLTPESAGAVLGALEQAWVNVTGQASDWSGILILAAQGAMETSNFAKLYDYNLGNIMHTAGDGYDYNHRPEVPQASMIYRVYDSLLEGAEDLVRWAIHHGAGDALQSGDVDGYMNALRAGCYLGCIGGQVPGGSVVSQSDYDTYQGGIESYMNRFSSVTPILPPSPSPLGWGAAIAGVAVLGGLAYVATHVKDGKVELPFFNRIAARKTASNPAPTASAPGLLPAAPPAPAPAAANEKRDPGRLSATALAVSAVRATPDPVAAARPRMLPQAPAALPPQPPAEATLVPLLDEDDEDDDGDHEYS